MAAEPAPVRETDDGLFVHGFLRLKGCFSALVARLDRRDQQSDSDSCRPLMGKYDSTTSINAENWQKHVELVNKRVTGTFRGDQHLLVKQLKEISDVVSPNGPLHIYKPPLHEMMKDPQKNITKFLVGQPNISSQAWGHFQERVLMLVGATGAGKSTMINAIANYILGVQWEDDFRFELFADEGSRSEAYSQTKWITAYTFPKRKGSPVPYTLTIIDTPGFGDTKGVERDKEVTRQIKEFFSIPSPDGIDQIHGIGFVAQASLSRLTPTQKYIFDSILSIYGKDIGDNIFMMFTFADNHKPPILAAIEAAKIAFNKSFKFNNSTLFALKEDNEDSDEDSDDENFDEMFWKMSYKHLESFFNEFEKVESKSLQLTREVLLERQQLEVTIQGLQPQIRTGLSKIDVLQQEETVLKYNEAEMVKNKRYTVTVTKRKRIDTTNCVKCNYTCHFSCDYASDEDKHMCSSMINGSCTVCPLKCDWQKHVNNPYWLEIYEEEEEERCFDDLKARYYEAREGKSAVETMIARMETELKELQMVVFSMIQDAQRSLKRLGEIALKPDPLSEVDYIDLLIESEIQQAEPGWKKRVKSLQDISDCAQNLNEKVMSRNLQRADLKS